MGFIKTYLTKLAVLLALSARVAWANPYASQLYEDLLYYYQKGVRPNENPSDIVSIEFGSSLIRIIDVDELNQLLKTNLWLDIWTDNKLKWKPELYGNILKVQLPADLIWTPDIVLYNTAFGDYQVTSQNFAQVYYTGKVVWKPPQIHTSFCEIDIRYFPYDEQNCHLKFGGWTYNGHYMDMKQLPVDESDEITERLNEDGELFWYSAKGMDLSYYTESKEWDLINLTSAKHSVLYPGCCGQEFYIDVTFLLTLRRKSLFYTCNLMIPSMLVAILTTFVFYLPSADHKITFAISILLQQTVFYNIMLDLIPPSSIALPLFGKYLLFTIILVSISLFVSVITLNLHRRTGATHPSMPAWMRVLFLELLPKPLCIKPYGLYDETDKDEDRSSFSVSVAVDKSICLDGIESSIDMSQPSGFTRKMSTLRSRRPSPYFMSVSEIKESQEALTHTVKREGMSADIIRRMIRNVRYCADYYRRIEEEDKISEEWSYVAMVIDRCFLIIFSGVNLVGTIIIIMASPSLTDHRTELPITPPLKPLGGETLSGYFANISRAVGGGSSGETL